MSRPLAEILLDLSNAREAWEKEAFKVPTSVIDDDLLSTLDNKLDDLREEFRARFKELTGVAWSNVEAVQMSAAL